MANIRRRCAEAYGLPFDDAAHGEIRSSMRKRKMRQTCEIAKANSASAEFLWIIEIVEIIELFQCLARD